ncbi:peptide-methionine (R)-S-oxide reductase MsrB [Tamlana fucoidanivorans]|uniref:peptide-methionine (R)-S-oxide reductase MsrB n=1 Tax=Allotamlana fucoidanivorans TaxID=2583814 RepID=UPI003743578A
MYKSILVFIVALLTSYNSCAQKVSKTEPQTLKVLKTEDEWRKQLSDKAFYVLRQGGTERAFSSSLNKNYAAGIYVCKGCKTPLFKSEHKFNSGTGWPSFDRAIEGNIAYAKNGSAHYGYEEHCAVCGGHLGHIFNDGPHETTGKRHCINGVALEFIPKN